MFSSRKEIKFLKEFKSSSSNNPSVNTKVKLLLVKFNDFNFKAYNRQSFKLHLLLLFSNKTETRAAQRIDLVLSELVVSFPQLNIIGSLFVAIIKSK